MAYDAKLPSCFGERDLEFAIHPLDAQQAFEWLIDLRKRQVPWIDAKAQIQDYLQKRGAGQEHVARQIVRARVMLGSWLSGPVGDDEPCQ